MTVSGNGLDAAMERIDGVKEVLNVRRVFGEPYQVDDVSIIPVAVIRGGGGGGGGEGDSGTNGKQGTGSGSRHGLRRQRAPGRRLRREER